LRLTNERANASVTIRDLLSQRVGIGEDDGRLWALGNRNRRAVIQAGMRAPQKSAPGTSFAYNSIMYSAAGEAVAGAFGLTWEEVIKTRLFEPLGMTASNTSITRTIHAYDYSVGYSRNKPVRMRNLDNIAPAGAINTTARDMAQWLRLLLAGGVWKGKRLVSTDGFRQVTAKQIEDPPGYYGLGWDVNVVRGMEIVMHSGAIDGFRAEVDWMPELSFGWAVMVNEDDTNLHREIGTIIMNKLVP
jgi:CubicO group peptidase (beta-lactamase class C family)